jgi:pilus assembly protein FimV
MITRKWSIKLATASALAALLYATTAIAVGFGDITLNSALNEPLDAEISLTNIEGIEEGLLLVQLAPASAFAQAGVSRDYYLTQLAFSVDTNGADETVVKVTSQGPILEPYLDFLVQLEWPAGRIVREYTLLLDLPLYSGEVTPAQVVNIAAASPKRKVASKRELAGDAHRVVVGDTLWNVSKRLRPRGSTILQTMDALYSQNPSAFVAGDANKMKEGAILRLPSFDEINEEAGDIVATQIGLTEPDAVSENDLFGDSSANDGSVNNSALNKSTSDTDSEDSSAGRLELASALNDTDEAAATSFANENTEGADSLSDSSGNSNDDIDQLNSDLAVAQDEMNRTELENIELRERMVLLEAQVDLMSDLAAASDNQALAEAADEAEVAAAAPIKATTPKKPFDLAETLENQPWIWALVGLVILLLVLFLRRSKNKNEDTDLDQPLTDSGSLGEGYQDYDQEPSVNTGSNLLIDDLDGLDLNPEDNLFDETDKEIFPEEDSAVSPEIFDSMVEAVAEADVYLSLGNVDQAVEILQDARAADAADTACRLKLMEIFFREDRRDDLKEIYTEVEEIGDDVATAMASVILGPEEEVVENIIEDIPELDEELLADEEPSADKELSANEGPSANEEPSADIEPSANDEPSASSDSALGSTPEIDISDLLEDVLESGDDIAIDALDESVLAGDFLDDNFMDGGIFADEASSEADKTANENSDLDVDMPSSAELQQTVSEGVSTNLDDFDGYDSDEDIDAVDVKLDLANTYIEMGDPEGAREILEEIIGEADAEGQAKAKAVLESL